MERVEGYNSVLGGYRTDGGRESQTIFLNDVIKLSTIYPSIYTLRLLRLEGLT